MTKKKKTNGEEAEGVCLRVFRKAGAGNTSGPTSTRKTLNRGISSGHVVNVMSYICITYTYHTVSYHIVPCYTTAIEKQLKEKTDSDSKGNHM